MGTLGGIRDDGDESVVGIEGGGKLAGLLLEAGEIVEVLGFGGLKTDGAGQIIDGVLGIALTGVKGSQGAGNFGGVGVEIGGLGEVGNGEGEDLGLRIN